MQQLIKTILLFYPNVRFFSHDILLIITFILKEQQMNQSIQNQKIQNVIDKMTSKTRQICEQFAQQLLGKIDPRTFVNAANLLQDALSELTNISKERFEQAVQLAKQQLHNKNCIDSQKLQPIFEIIVNKQREKDYDQDIEQQWKRARSIFFTQKLNKKLSEAHIPQQHQTKINQLFTEAKQNWYNRLDINLNQLGKLSEHKELIQQLIQTFDSLNLQFFRKQNQCPTLTQIIQLKLTSLIVINIQHRSIALQMYRYQISAFELFKVVHENRDLSSVTIKGVNVIRFEQFIKAIGNSKQQQKEEQDWIKNFKPLKSLQLAIDAKLQFIPQNNKENIDRLDNLKQFVGLFDSVSDIRVNIRLGRKKEQFQDLLQQLKMLKKIKITILGVYNYEVDQSFIYVFAGLASLTEIVQLQFEYVKFSPQIGVNYFLAIQQFLRTIFDNNAITHLRIFICQHFPIFPTITSMQSVTLWDVSFRRKFNFMNELAENSPSLRSITCCSIEQDWRIDEHLFNKLRQLDLCKDCQSITLDIQTHQPSEIKQLAIQIQNLNNFESISLLFTKLVSLQYLSINKIGLGHQVLCTIPSPHLEQLRIYDNNKIKNIDLKAIDRKWPSLRRMTLRDCPKLNEIIWHACEFQGLVQLKIGPEMLTDKQRRQLIGRGIKVQQWN